ncbi:MAG: AMIN domain-containing protein, partial [Myxococcales bacterium]
MASCRIRVAAWLACACVASSASAQTDLNVISAVRVHGGKVEIVGTKKPNFTTFSMSDPTRLVVDVSEAVFRDVPGQLKVDNGVITTIKTASYGSDQSAIARVLIGFAEDPDTEIETHGGTLVVRVVDDGLPIASSEVPSGERLLVASASEANQPVSQAGAGSAPVDDQKRLEEERLLAEKQAREEAERKRLEEERLLAEQKAREAEQKRLEEERRIAELKAREAEQKRLEEERRIAELKAREAKQKRLEEERRIAEQKAREAEQKRLEEERRIAEQKA